MFARLGAIVAFVGLILGVLRAGSGLIIAFIPDAEARAAAAGRYLGSSTSGQAIDKGMMIVASVVIGVVVEIAWSVRRS